MPTDKEIFDEVVRTQRPNCGRLLDDSPVRKNPLLQNNKDLVDRIINGFRTTGNPLKEFPKVIVDYIDSPVPDVWAKLHNDTYIIAISYGTLLVIEFMFNRLLSNRSFMPDYGDILKESDELPAISVTLDFDEIAAQLQSHNLSVQDYIPKDEERRSVADFLITTSIFFMMGHEFRHIQAGHCDYYKNKFDFTHINETTANTKNIKTSMKQQAMEWDADLFSFGAILREKLRAHHLSKASPQIFDKFYSQPEILFFLIIISCFGFFRLLDAEFPAPAQWPYRSHPPSRNRRMTLIIDGSRMAEAIDPDTFNSKLIDSVIMMCADYDILLYEISGIPFDNSIAGLDIKESINHHLRVIQVWNSIVGNLRKYSFVPIQEVPFNAYAYGSGGK